MYTENFTDLSVVRLKNGRIGTVVHIYPDGKSAIIEIDDTNELLDTGIEEVQEVMWAP